MKEHLVLITVSFSDGRPNDRQILTLEGDFNAVYRAACDKAKQWGARRCIIDTAELPITPQALAALKRSHRESAWEVQS